MPLINVGLLNQNQTISQSGTYDVSFAGVGTLTVAGTLGQPIDVTLSQLAGAGLLNNYVVSNANVTLGGVAGVGALVTYSIGSGGTLSLQNLLGVTAGSTVTFTGNSGTLKLGNGVNLSLLSGLGIAGFGPGDTIDVSAVASSVTYADNSGSGTGGTLRLLDGSGQTVATLALTTGEYNAGEFRLTPDGTGGTQVMLGVVTTGVTASPMTADLGAGVMVALTANLSAPVTVVGGVPTLSLNDGGTAVYDPAASTGSTLAFKYMVAPGENTPDLAVVSLSLNGATVTGTGGVPVDLTGVAVNPAGTLQIDTTAPTVTGVTMTPGSGAGTPQPGQTVSVGLGMSEAVGVTGGTPMLMLSDGGTATYDPGSSTPTMLMFTHTVGAGENAGSLEVTSVSLNGSSISDPAGNVADLSGALINPNGGITSGAGGSGGTGGNGAAGASGSTGSVLGVYRFFDSGTGTHFFTADVNEKNTLMNPASPGYRADLKEEVNNFGAVNPGASDPNVETVFRFFDTVHGTHFFTASQSEASSLMSVGSSTYRPDLVYEASSSFLEHTTQQTGDVAVYRFFDKTYGTHFYTGSQSEFAAITTAGTASYRADLVSEGVGFYAPAGTYS